MGLFCGAFSFALSMHDVILHEMSGKTIRAADLDGKWLVLNYWAPWCHICIREIPELNSFYQHNRNPNIVFYGVHYDHPPVADLREAASSMNIHFPVLVEDPAPIWKLSVEEAVPVTYIISPRGVIAKVIYGPNTEEALLETLRELQR
jgi:peroxiredoxin